MNTPSHMIVNWALLLNASQTPATLPMVALGAVLPDLPMFVLYGWAKVRRIPARTLWQETYYLPFWQLWTDVGHSIPLAATGVGLGFLLQWPALQMLCGSMILHSLLDIPVHHEDAHRHFLPLSNYRLISPLSYWDPRHYGYQVAFVEMLAVAIATFYLFPRVDAWPVRVFCIAITSLYALAYGALTWRRRQLCAAAPAKVPTPESAVPPPVPDP